MDVMAKFSPGLRDFPGVEFCPLGASTITSQKLCVPSYFYVGGSGGQI